MPATASSSGEQKGSALLPLLLSQVPWLPNLVSPFPLVKPYLPPALGEGTTGQADVSKHQDSRKRMSVEKELLTYYWNWVNLYPDFGLKVKEKLQIRV